MHRAMQNHNLELVQRGFGGGREGFNDGNVATRVMSCDLSCIGKNWDGCFGGDGKDEGIEELREKRDEIRKMLRMEEEEKSSIQKDLVVLTKRLAIIDDSLVKKYAYADEYDKTIEEVEGAYSKILESSQALLHVLRTETIRISSKRISPTRRDFTLRNKKHYHAVHNSPH